MPSKGGACQGRIPKELLIQQLCPAKRSIVDILNLIERTTQMHSSLHQRSNRQTFTSPVKYSFLFLIRTIDISDVGERNVPCHCRLNRIRTVIERRMTLNERSFISKEKISALQSPTREKQQQQQRER